MNKLTEKIKNIFLRSRTKSVNIMPPQDIKIFKSAFYEVGDIARSIRESQKFQLKKNLWHKLKYNG